jgi:uncharacterized protein YidB (DUF937 family)
MLEQLLSMVKDLGQDQVVNNPDVPNEYNETVMATASQSLLGTFQQAIAGGQGQELLNIFQGQNDNEIMANPLAQQVQGSFLENITSKLGINSQTASGLAATYIPMIMNQLVRRTNSTAAEDSGFSLESLVGGLTGGKQGGLDIGGLIGQFTGGGAQQGGGIGDLLNRFTGNNKQGEGDMQDMLGNLVKGFFGK